MFKVIHLIPYDAVGGVETAAKSMYKGIQEPIAFEIEYIFKNIVSSKNKWATINPLTLLAVAWRISRGDADVLIVSLWRSSIVGLIVKLLRPKLKLITFLHLDQDVHLPDYICTRLSMWLSTQVWADSQATLDRRFNHLQSHKCKVISFVTERFEVLPVRTVGPSFVFWGRISQQKGLERAIRLFAAVRKICSDAQFTIIGPDGGELNTMQKLCASMGLKESVIFLGVATHAEIINHARQASFYIQTSVFEGMAMSVVEAMQLGLLPVVTPVGEIGTYCKAGVNSVIVSSEQQAVGDVLDLLNKNGRYQEMRTNAIATWLHKPLYRDSFRSACVELFCESVTR
jgi:glycosyltransferase involved in cell wall biosynthesis